jgi:heme-degrading monooxygenase HmoA
MGVVLDASVVVKWFIDEQRSGAARRAFSAKVKKGSDPFFLALDWEGSRAMMVVVFQVTMREGRTQDYFDLAAELRPELERVEGFISVERFQSLAEPGKYVSLSFWRDQAAIESWRAQRRHRAAQERGKREIFADFRISVAEVVRDYTLEDRREPTAVAAPL